MLGDCYTLGQGTIKDLKLGTAWYKKAAEKGKVQAMRFVGDAYLYGDGVAEDKREAYRWYARAADSGDKDCLEKMLKYVKEQGNKDEIAVCLKKLLMLGTRKAQRPLNNNKQLKRLTMSCCSNTRHKVMLI